MVSKLLRLLFWGLDGLELHLCVIIPQIPPISFPPFHPTSYYLGIYLL